MHQTSIILHFPDGLLCSLFVASIITIAVHVELSVLAAAHLPVQGYKLTHAYRPVSGMVVDYKEPCTCDIKGSL